MWKGKSLLLTLISFGASVCAAIAAIVSLATTRRTKRLIKHLERAIVTIRDETIPLIRDAKGNLSATETELGKLETLIDSTTVATNLMGKTSRIALATVTNPIVEAKSLSAGIKQAFLVFKSKKHK